LIYSAGLFRHTAASTKVYDRTRPNLDLVRKLLDQIEHTSLHPQVGALKATLQDFVSGAPARMLVLAKDSGGKLLGALTYVDAKDEQEIKSLGVVSGDATARSLIRTLNHQKTLTVSAQTADHELYDQMGFQHSEELEDGEPSLMVKLPPGHQASTILSKAREFAAKAHENAGQLRKYTNEPYIIHPEGVVKILQENGVLSPNVLAAAYLHDTVEDTAVTLEDIKQEFGDEIAGLVAMLTDVAKPEDGNRAVRMSINKDHAAQASPDGQNIKLADLIHNVRDIATNDPKFAARVYLPEKEAVLNVLTNADPKLIALAWEELNKAKEMSSHKKAFKLTESHASTIFFHGTDSESSAQSIIQNGIQPRDVVNPEYRGRGWMAPPKGRVYITPSLGYAAIYALGGDIFGSSSITNFVANKDPHGFIFEVSGKDLAGDVQPDEDYIGRTLWVAWTYSDALKRLANIENGSQPRSGSELDNLKDRVDEMGREPINNPVNESIRLELLALAKNKLTDGQIKRVRHGEYAEWARSGKKLQKVLPDSITQAMLAWGAHVSHSGTVMPTRAWKFKKEDAMSIKSGAEIMQICTEVSLKPKMNVASRILTAHFKRKVATDMSQLFCPNPDCADFEKVDHGNLSQEFAYGVNSDRHMIYCSTCKTRFSETKCTEFFGAKLSGEEIGDILDKTVEGKSIRDIADELDLNKDSVNNVLLKAKEICEDYIGNKENTKVTTEIMTDMKLPKSQKSSVREFIDEIVIPGIHDEKSDDKKDSEA